jgi:hypothetical protein
VTGTQHDPILVRCPLCDGQACEENCGSCGYVNAGPNSHRVCTRCQGAGQVPACSCDPRGVILHGTSDPNEPRRPSGAIIVTRCLACQDCGSDLEAAIRWAGTVAGEVHAVRADNARPGSIDLHPGSFVWVYPVGAPPGVEYRMVRHTVDEAREAGWIA